MNVKPGFNIVMGRTRCLLLVYSTMIRVDHQMSLLSGDFQISPPHPHPGKTDNLVNVVKYLNISAEHNIAEMFLRAELLVRCRWKSPGPGRKCSGFKFWIP